MKEFKAKDIRNIALLGHSNCGKTSIAEAMLYMSKATDRLGKINDGNTVCDFDAEEIRRRASVNSTLAFCEWENFKINILDAPGLFDFEAGVSEAVFAAGAAIIGVSGKSGVSVGTEKAYKLVKKYNKPSIFFVNKIDAEHADFLKTYNQLKEKFGASVFPMIMPYKEDGEVKCYVNLLTKQAFTYDSEGKPTEISVPHIDGYIRFISSIAESVAEVNDEYMEKYFSGEEFTRKELVLGVREGVRTGKLTPVICGSALTLAGIDMLLETVGWIMTSAESAISMNAINKNGSNCIVTCSESEPLLAYVFKTVNDQFGKMSYFKVIKGKLTPDTVAYNLRTGKQERFGKLLFLNGKKQIDTKCIVAGDIGVATKIDDAQTGDTYSFTADGAKIIPIPFPKPTYSMAVVAENKGDEGKISQVLSRILEEDCCLTVYNNPETHEQIISGLGEQHLEIVATKLKAKSGIGLILKEPVIPFRETIRKKVKVQGKHKKQSGGHGQFGDVWIEFEPYDGDGLVFETNVFGGSVPKNFFPAVEKGLEDASKKGVLAGYPMVGLKATLVDGSYHPVDSSEMSFKMAAALAYKTGIAQASPALLEPICTLKASVPESCTGDIMSEINKRRGKVLGMSPSDDGTVIEAEVPQAEMHDFTTLLRQTTQGRGSFTLDFARYEQMPPNIQEEVIKSSGVTEE